jgi:hypothetical protein
MTPEDRLVLHYGDVRLVLTRRTLSRIVTFLGALALEEPGLDVCDSNTGFNTSYRDWARELRAEILPDRKEAA